MKRDRIRLVVRPLSALVLACVCVVAPAGCGGEKKEGQAPPPDPAVQAQQNKSMEDYMNSKEGKAASAAPK